MQSETVLGSDYAQLKAQVNDLQEQLGKCSAELQEWRYYSSLVLYAFEQVFPHVLDEDNAEGAHTLETEEEVVEICTRVRDGYHKLSRVIRELRPQAAPLNEFAHINRSQFQAWCDIIEGKPPSIVLLHNDPNVRSGWEMLIKDWYPRARLTVFSDSTAAWENLSNQFGGVLIIGDRGVGGREIVKSLVERGARMSVLVISSFPEATRPWVEQYATGGSSILYLEIPCLAEDLKAVLDFWLKPASPITMLKEALPKPESCRRHPPMSLDRGRYGGLRELGS